MPNQSPAAIISSPLGKLAIYTNENKLIAIEFANVNTPLKTAQNTFSKKVTKELQSYFKNPNHTFNVALQPAGTTLQKKIWQALKKIPCSKTLNYGTLAAQLNTGARVIGNACRKNPLPIIVPCHRVVAKNGLGGYAGKKSGANLERKIWLLKHENKTK